MKSLNELTATEIVAAIASGRTSCEQVVRACLDRIAVREADVGAWNYLDADQALAAARKLDAGASRGPLHGVPVGVKDIVDTCDMPTEYGTVIHKGHRPPYDAACVALTRKAGGLILGKTVTTEFANVGHGKTRNPHDLARTPGGSSSGSAAAVADFMVPLAIGTQTTGSTTRPASFCGVFGYRPSWGELRTSRVMEAAASFDSLGILARSLEDVALYRDVLLGVEPVAITPAAAPRIGFCRTYFWDRIEPDTRRQLEEAALELARTGAIVEDVTLPPDFEQVERIHRTVSGFEFARNFSWEIQNRWDDISQALRESRILDGLNCSYETYRDALIAMEHLRTLLAPILAPYDVLLAPSAPGEATTGWNPIPHPWVYMLWTTMHVPSVTLPVFKGPNGLPVGAQIIGKPRKDGQLFSACQWIWQRLH